MADVPNPEMVVPDEPVIVLPPDPEVPEADALEQATVIDPYDDDWR